MFSITPPPLLIVNSYSNSDTSFATIDTLESPTNRHVISFRRPPFNDVDIQSWLKTSVTKMVPIGYGTQSQASVVTTTDGTRYILRTTLVKTIPISENIQREIRVYRHIFEQPDASQYVSNLLYADCPGKFHNDDEQDTAYFVFEFVEGVPLDTFISSLISNGQSIKQSTADTMLESMRHDVDFLERVGVVHRDIKPANLFLDTTNNRILLFDFETSCFVGDDCKSVEFIGTQYYATANALQLKSGIFPKPHVYTHADDRHAVQVIMDLDIAPIIHKG